MNARPDLTSPVLADVPSNPVPQGAATAMFTTSDGVKLRYATFPKGEGASRGTICLIHGRAEFIEKYFETIADFQARGFSVATFDWRGQGGSQRLIGNPRLGYVDTFDDYWVDLKSFHSSVLLPDCPPPYHLVGHSMGGLVALNAGARDRMMFERIFVTSPMLAVQLPVLSMAGWAPVFDTMSLLGLGRMPISRGTTDLAPSEKSFPGNPVTSDARRYLRMVEVLRARPDLLIGPPTVRWTGAAVRAMLRAARDDFPGSIKIPVLMLASASDEVVITSATETLGLRMRTGHHLIVPSSRHELLMENDAVRAQVFAAFDAFITQQTS
jgi:lysophospholipase